MIKPSGKAEHWFVDDDDLNGFEKNNKNSTILKYFEVTEYIEDWGKQKYAKLELYL